MGKQYLGGIGKIANGVVSVSSVYADERLYYPLAVEPYTPAHHFEGGKADPAFRTKPHIALQLVEQAIEMELPFRAVVGPGLTTFYLFTNLPAPEPERSAGNGDLAPADVAEVVRLYALRSWIEQSYKQVKNALGWAHYQLRKDLSIRRHWQLVCCAFSFCWWACRECGEMRSSAAVVVLKDPELPSSVATHAAVGGKKEDRHPATTPVVAAGAAEGALVASALRNAVAILEGVLRYAPACGAKKAA